jgi:hypothetical protein
VVEPKHGTLPPHNFRYISSRFMTSAAYDGSCDGDRVSVTESPTASAGPVPFGDVLRAALDATMQASTGRDWLHRGDLRNSVVAALRRGGAPRGRRRTRSSGSTVAGRHSKSRERRTCWGSWHQRTSGSRAGIDIESEQDLVKTRLGADRSLAQSLSDAGGSRRRRVSCRTTRGNSLHEASTVVVGTAEVLKNLVAERVLALLR